MSYLLTIDPGTCSGVALFAELNLISCQLVEDPWTPLRYPNTEVICEFPFVYPGGRGKGDGNDLLKVARIAGRLTAQFPEVEWILPRSWKGNVPKEIMLDRILGKLSERERALLPRLPKYKLHNVLDAVGIGLHELGRL